MDEPAIPWREIITLVWRRRRLIALVFAVGASTVGLYSWLRAPAYEASAKLMVTSERARITVSPDAGSKPTIEPVTEQDLNSEVALLESSALVREVLRPYRKSVDDGSPTGLRGWVAAILHLPLDLPKALYRRLHGVPPLSRFEKWVESSAARVSVSPVTKSNLIDVSFTDSSPAWAAEFVNKLVSAHVENHVRLNQQADTRRFFEGQRDLLSDKLRQAETALRRFYDREGIVESVPEQRTLLRNRLAELELQLSKAQTSVAESTARSEYLRQQIQTYPKSIPVDAKSEQNDGVQLVRSHLLTLELKRSEMLSKFAPASLNIRDIDRQIADARRLLATEKRAAAETGRTANPNYQALQADLTQTDAQLVAMKARVTSLESQVALRRADVEHLERIASEQEQLEQEVTTAKESFLTYLKKEEEARFADALDESRIVNVAIVEPATVPAAPLPSKGLLNTILAAALSLILGVVIAFIRDRMDPSVKTAAEARAITGLPILADLAS